MFQRTRKKNHMHIGTLKCSIFKMKELERTWEQDVSNGVGAPFQNLTENQHLKWNIFYSSASFLDNIHKFDLLYSFFALEKQFGLINYRPAVVNRLMTSDELWWSGESLWDQNCVYRIFSSNYYQCWHNNSVADTPYEKVYWFFMK